MSIDDAALAADISAMTWRKVEGGQSVRRLTYAGVERALAWKPGSIDLIIDGHLDEASTETLLSVNGSGKTAVIPAVSMLSTDWPVNALLEMILRDDRLSDERKLEAARVVIEARADADRHAADELRRRLESWHGS